MVLPMETPAEYFQRTEASQWQALKMLGHSHARVEELKEIHEREMQAKRSWRSTPTRPDR